MSLEPITIIQSRVIVLEQANIDTDQIIPARFLTTIGRDGLGKHAFHDLRYRSDGTPIPRAPLNSNDLDKRQILVAGPNFGCGSSREHAVWALQQLGFRALISSRLADIFRSNALKNGLLAIELKQDQVDEIAAATSELVIDLARQEVTTSDGATYGFDIDAFAKRCLTEGTDALGLLLAAECDIQRFEEEAC